MLAFKPMLQPILELFASDPFVGYTLLAALFLGLISLVSGWGKLDFMALFQPRALMHVTVAVLLAALLTLGQRLFVPGDATLTTAGLVIPAEALQGLSRLPLYLVALAYGPSIGLISAGLFAAFATTSGNLGWSEAVLALELVTLGWFAIAPSPFKVRWAGPLNVMLSYFLAWATGGSAFLQYTTQRGMDFSTHLNYHLPILLGVALSALFLLFVGPELYKQAFKDSRIAPAIPKPSTIVIPLSDLQHRQKLRERGKLTELNFDPLEFRQRRSKN
jgi:hypothetical protein